MSLHALANHMATKGRGGDSVLVHMTPEEVQSLQVLALKGGGTLTINPDTGLPEANFLKKMLPMIAGFALAPLTAGTSLAFLGATPLASALTVGGITGLATGSLSRGLMAGLGAYGGASLGAGLAGAGAGAAQEAAVAGLTGEQLATQAAAQGLTEQGVLNQAAAEATKNFAASGAGSQLAQGAKAAFSNPKALMSSLGGPMGTFKAAYAAATPMLAGEMVPTTTQMPDSANTKAYIRPKRFDPYTQQMVSYDPILASEFGSRRLSDFTSGDGTPGSASGLAGLDTRRPAGMASGGIVALAAGGKPDISQLMSKAGVDFLTASDLLYGVVGSNQDTRNWGAIMAAADPAAAARQATANMYGGVNVGTVNDADGSHYRATSGSNINLTSGTDQGLGGRAINFGVGLTPGDQYIFGPSTMASVPVTSVVPGAGGAVVSDAGFTPDVPSGYYGNPTGPAPTPGDIITNNDGTRTVVPNIPGRPTGGFAGMEQVRDAYTRGGGSLGYTPYAPVTLQEFQNRYTNTGGSKQAYDFLANKGASDISRPITKTGELMLPYADVMNLRRQRPAGARAPVVAAEDEAVTTTPVEEAAQAANGGVMRMALGGLGALAAGGETSRYNLGSYSDGGRLLRGPGDGVSDSIPATIGDKQPARLADGEFVVPARIVSELGNGSTEAGARKLYAMMDRVQKARGKTTGKNRVAANTRSEKFLPA